MVTQKSVTVCGVNSGHLTDAADEMSRSLDAHFSEAHFLYISKRLIPHTHAVVRFWFGMLTLAFVALSLLAGTKFRLFTNLSRLGFAN